MDDVVGRVDGWVRVDVLRWCESSCLLEWIVRSLSTLLSSEIEWGKRVTTDIHLGKYAFAPPSVS
jgi:hypothetical protein